MSLELNKELQDAFLKAVDSLDLRFAGKDICEKTGYKSGTVSEYLNAKKNVSESFLKNFSKAYGLEYKKLFARFFDGKEPRDFTISPFNKGKKKDGSGLIPYYEVDFMAGSSMEFYEEAITPAYYMDIPEFRGCTAFRAYADSMEELITSGNILFATKIEDWESHLEYGQIYGITMKDNRRYLKFIRRFKENPKDYFLLKSQNVNYDEFEIPKNKIKNIWLIEGWMNRRT